MKAWEHEPTHEELGDSWKPRYDHGRDIAEPEAHPVVSPDKPRKAWTK